MLLSSLSINFWRFFVNYSTVNLFRFLLLSRCFFKQSAQAVSKSIFKVQIISAQQIVQFHCLVTYELFVSTNKQLVDPLFSSYSVKNIFLQFRGSSSESVILVQVNHNQAIRRSTKIIYSHFEHMFGLSI